jgi:hypothetical protein
MQDQDNVSDLIESCQRNCLLALSLVYMPMPGMPQQERTGAPCCNCCRGGSGTAFTKWSKNLDSTRSAMLMRMLATSSQTQAAQAPPPGPAFSLATLLPGDAVHAVFTHQHIEAESQLALDLISLLHTVSFAQLPADLELVCPLANPTCDGKTNYALQIPATLISGFGQMTCIDRQGSHSLLVRK